MKITDHEVSFSLDGLSIKDLALFRRMARSRGIELSRLATANTEHQHILRPAAEKWRAAEFRAKCIQAGLRAAEKKAKLHPNSPERILIDHAQGIGSI